MFRGYAVDALHVVAVGQNATVLFQEGLQLERRPLEPRGAVALYCLDGASLNGRVERPPGWRFDKNDGLLCLFDSFRLDAGNVPFEQPAVGERFKGIFGAAPPLLVL